MKAWKQITLCCLVAAAGLLTGCKSSRGVTGKSPSAGSLNRTERVERVLAQAPQTECINAKMRFSLQLGEKDFSIGGNFRMKKDDVIQLSLVGFGIIEGGRIEFTRDSVLLVDRLHHQYISVAYNDVASCGSPKWTFTHSRHSSGTNSSCRDCSTSPCEARHFDVSREGDSVVLTGDGNRRLAYRFFTSLVTGLLERTEISSRSDYRLDWTYGDFVDLGGAKYPAQMRIELFGLRTSQ